ncbi:hypothetical protein OC846_004472 [Tilletia horrida]|uniref:TPR-like protein n=1 Tax=Tilletia horrida TaxID=155126 RepID=A0AAN6JR36_9BASI|nr:hypothetical protein OC846_004472 [Tilletia horrida]KAK0549434.1 hypothetical protein OC845_003139 [Tilletia horrida]KAK0561403.1 hypothetical protein OC861_005842 [Tilletia horrida]
MSHLQASKANNVAGTSVHRSDSTASGSALPTYEAVTTELGELNVSGDHDALPTFVESYNQILAMVPNSGPVLKDSVFRLSQALAVIQHLTDFTEEAQLFTVKAKHAFQHLISLQGEAGCQIRPGTHFAALIEPILNSVNSFHHAFDSYYRMNKLLRGMRKSTLKKQIQEWATEIQRAMQRLTARDTLLKMLKDDSPMHQATTVTPSSTKATPSKRVAQSPAQREAARSILHHEISAGLNKMKATLEAEIKRRDGRIPPDDDGQGDGQDDLFTPDADDRYGEKSREARSSQRLPSLDSRDLPPPYYENSSQPNSAEGGDQDPDPAHQALKVLTQLCIARDLIRPAEHVDQMRKLSDLLYECNLLQLVLQVDQYTVAIRRHREGSGHASNRTELSSALVHLGWSLSAAKRHQEAMACSTEALEITRFLTKLKPDTYDLSLARALNGLAYTHKAVGQTHKAVEESAEAVTLFREVYRKHPREHNSEAAQLELADLLSHHCSTLDKAGHRDDALAISEESLSKYRTLYQANPARLRTKFARRLDDHGKLLRHSKRHLEAVDAIEEAVTLYQDLYRAQPLVYEDDLANTSVRQYKYLTQVERHDEAAAAIGKALALYRSMHKRQPAKYKDNLVSTFYHHFSSLEAAGLDDEADEATEECIEFYRALYHRQPEQYEDNFAEALNAYAWRLVRTGGAQEALPYSQESVQLYRAAKANHRKLYRPDNFAASLDTYALCLYKTGRYTEAVSPAEEALSIFRAWVAKENRRELERDLLATIVGTHGKILAAVGRLDDARTALGEARELYLEERAAGESRPDRYRKELQEIADVEEKIGGRS